jgi:hypothetical protein
MVDFKFLICQGCGGGFAEGWTRRQRVDRLWGSFA